MKKKIGVIALLGVSTVFPEIANKFNKVPLDRRYDQVCFASAHNAYASKGGYLYFNQSFSIKDQLAYGVRAFEIDTYFFCPSSSKLSCQVSVCHGECDKGNRFIYKTLDQILNVNPLSFEKDILPIFKKFLEENGQEIITLTLENYVDKSHGAAYDTLDKQFEKVGIAKFILKPDDWNPKEKKGWPTLEWMIKRNKRLVVFNSESAENEGVFINPYVRSAIIKSTNYTYYQWACIAQNQWAGAKNIEIALQERGSSQQYDDFKRYLLELDWFPDGGTPLDSSISKIINTFGGIFAKNKETPFVGDYNKVNGDDLATFLTRTRAEGIRGRVGSLAKGRAPNFIKVDEVGKGRVMDFVNAINAEANDPQKREQMFAPIGGKE